MRVVADHKIPYVEETFGHFGAVIRLPSTELTAAACRDADVLLVRSETRVDSALLNSSRVRFVGSPTIGVDHIDLSYLGRSGRGFASAPGCNARSVVEYVLTALVCVAARRKQPLEGKTIGIVGVGNIGSRLAEVAPRLGLQVLLNDPPRRRLEGDSRFLSLDDLAGADFLTLHVPLLTEGPDATRHLFDQSRIESLTPHGVLINTSRGPVVDNHALCRVLQAGRLGGAVLDVWEGEPEPLPELVRLADLATPHIAGYSADGKLRGTWAVFESFCRFFRLDGAAVELPPLPPPDPAVVGNGGASDSDPARGLGRALEQAYPIRRDDRNLRRILDLPPSERARYFRELRANYPLRREFAAFRISGHETGEVRRRLVALGFSANPGACGSDSA